jgi:hypothetical protein
LTTAQFYQLVTSAVFFYQQRFLADQELLSGTESGPFYHENLAVTVDGTVIDVAVTIGADSTLTVRFEGGDQVVISDMNFKPGHPVFEAKANNEPYIIQYIEHHGHRQTLSFYGTDVRRRHWGERVRERRPKSGSTKDLHSPAHPNRRNSPPPLPPCPLPCPALAAVLRATAML